MTIDPPPAVSQAGQYLTVNLAGASCGIAFSRVQEVIPLQKITPIPQLPDYVRGVISLRGRVVPVVNLRLRFGLPAASTDRTCLVVTRMHRAGHNDLLLGLVVGAVEEVMSFTEAEIELTPESGTPGDISCLLGLVRRPGEVKALLDVDRVIGGATLAAFG